MIKIITALMLALLIGCADDKDETSKPDVQPSSTSDYQVSYDNWGNGWFRYRSQGHECIGKLYDGFARCTLYRR